MLIKRAELLEALEKFNLLKDKKFNINTQYKILKILAAADEEESIFQE